MQPDGQLYSSLMDVAGQAKRVDLAFDLQADMVAQGLQPSQVIIMIIITRTTTILITTIIITITIMVMIVMIMIITTMINIKACSPQR